MKRTSLLPVLTLALVFSLGAVGCRKSPERVTPIPGSRTATPRDSDSGMQPIGPGGALGQRPPLNQDNVGSTTEALPLPTDSELGRPIDIEALRGQTVYFDFDRSAVKSAELPKVQAVADYLRGNPTKDVLVAGHCDERGTEEYNRALGERRALSVRETLVRLGISSNRVFTRSYGEDMPADPGHNDAAWDMNRRAEFIVVLPRQ